MLELKNIDLSRDASAAHFVKHETVEVAFAALAGELASREGPNRYAAGDGNVMRQLPWATPLKDYKTLHGHRLPGYAETIYTYPEGDLCYGQFSTTNVEYNCK